LGFAGLGIYFDSQAQTPMPVVTNTQPSMNLRPKIPATTDERRKSLAEIRSINDRIVAENFPSDLQIAASLAQPSRQDATVAVVNDPFAKVTAEGVYVLTINTESNNVETIYSRRGRTAFPIASISKMMALVTSDLTAAATTSVVISTSTKAVYPNDTLFTIRVL
jgi:CO dehydrogenase/acetyl-CoA synthase gamma subunit (corrinoid Fe-S protein)